MFQIIAIILTSFADSTVVHYQICFYSNPIGNSKYNIRRWDMEPFTYYYHCNHLVLVSLN